MNIKELRIGNIVKIEDLLFNELFKCQEINMFNAITLNALYVDMCNDSIQYEFLPNNLEPIEITKQLFYELGFKSDNDDSNILTKDSFEVIMLANNNFELMNHDYMIKIKYVHQLQNLYFALTGKELELNKKS